MALRAGLPTEGADGLSMRMHAYVTYVGLDQDGQMLPARQFTPVTEDDRRLWDHQQVLRELRRQFTPLPLFEAPVQQLF